MCLKVIYLVLLLINGLTSAVREKRTIDLVLRSVADAFGYDVLKRPTVLPPAATTLAPAVSTFFPPPLKPLPPAPRPAIFPVALPPPKAPPPPPPKVPVQPPKTNARFPKAPLPPLLPPLPRPTAPPPLPKAPPAPPKAPAAPPKAPPAPPPKRPAPVLTETVQKTFNLAFNWNKNVQPGQPGAAPAPAPAPAAGKPPPAPAAAPPPPPQPAPAPAAPIPTRPAPGGQHFLKKPQLYRDYDYLNEDQPKENLAVYDEDEAVREQFGQRLPASEEQLNYDYLDNQNQNLNQDYSESTKNIAKKPYGNEATQSKERFKESVNTFWKNFPQTEQHGYKYIARPVNKVEGQAQFSQNFPNSKYEAYELVPINVRPNLIQQQQQHDCPPQQSSAETIQHKQPLNNVLQATTIPDYQHNRAKTIKNVQTIAPNYETVQQYNRPKNINEALQATKDRDYETIQQHNPQETDYDEDQAYVYLVPKTYVEYYDEEPQQRSRKEDQQNNLKNQRRNNSETKASAETIAHPLYSGILPRPLHHLARSESRSDPWSVPYHDYEIESTENKNKYVKKDNNPQAPKSESEDCDYTLNCYEKEPSNSNYDFYAVPEPKEPNYAQFEKLHTDYDDDFSKNAKIETKEQKVSVIKTNKFENPVKY